MADFNTAVGEDENSKAAAEAAGEVAAASAADGPKTAGVAAAEAAEEAAAASVADGPKTAGGAAEEAGSSAAAAAAAKMVVLGLDAAAPDAETSAATVLSVFTNAHPSMSILSADDGCQRGREGQAVQHTLIQHPAHARVTRIPRWKEVEMADLVTLHPPELIESTLNETGGESSSDDVTAAADEDEESKTAVGTAQEADEEPNAAAEAAEEAVVVAEAAEEAKEPEVAAEAAEEAGVSAGAAEEADEELEVAAEAAEEAEEPKVAAEAAEEVDEEPKAAAEAVEEAAVDAAAVAVEYGMVAAGTLTKNVPPVARWSEADQMCSIIEPNHSKLNLIGAPVVTAAYTDAGPLLATDEGSSLAANEPWGPVPWNALFEHRYRPVVQIEHRLRPVAHEAAARLARVLRCAPYRHDPARADQELFSRAGPADTRPRSSSWLSAETSQEHREQGAAESNAASGRVLARGRVRQVPRGVQTREWATAEAKAGAGETPVAQTCEATVAEAKTGIGEMPSPARPSL
jgi:hypothetical protein